jgi:hypothetical protein
MDSGREDDNRLEKAPWLGCQTRHCDEEDADIVLRWYTAETVCHEEYGKTLRMLGRCAHCRAQHYVYKSLESDTEEKWDVELKPP